MKKKFKIKLDGEEQLDIFVSGIIQDNIYKYLEKDLMVSIQTFKDKITIKRNNTEYLLTLNLEKNKQTISTYEFIGGEKVFNLNTYVNELIISDNSIYVKYNLEGNDFEFSLEVVE